MKKIEFEGIDVTKALLFILLALFTAIGMTALVVVPGVRDYKIQQIKTDRAFTNLRYAKNNYEATVTEYNELLEKNRPVIDALLTRHDKERFTVYGTKSLGRLEVVESAAVPWENHFYVRELNLTTRQKGMDAFYGFVQALNDYEGLAELDFPVEIKATDDYQLELGFKVRVYTLKDKAPEKISGEKGE